MLEIALTLWFQALSGNSGVITPPSDFDASLDFSDPRNSQYVALLFEDI